MAKIKAVQRIKSSSSISRTRSSNGNIMLKSSLAKSKLKDTKINKSAYGAKKDKHRSIAQIINDIKDTVKALKGKKDIPSLIKASTKDRIERADKQLSVFAVRSIKKDVFKFVCKSSGIGPQKNYQFEVQFSDVVSLALAGATIEEVFSKSSVKLQCSCDDFKYRYRFLATKGRFVLGTPQHIAPKITNKYLTGALCKHSILVLSKLSKPSFMKIFERYVNNKVSGKQTRIKKSEIVSTIASSSRSKI